MQDHDWNDLKYVLALHRTGRLARAGNALGVSETTVARRIRSIERQLGAALFTRDASGAFQATDAGLAAIGRAETIEQENIALRESMDRLSAHLSGTVRVSSVPIIVNRILVPNLTGLRDSHPGLTLELVPEARNVDLSKREADIALRFARPDAGGLRTAARRIGTLTFAAFGPAGRQQSETDALPWIGYDDIHHSLPQARWLEAAARSSGTDAFLRVADAETALEAAACGLGRTLLPEIVGTSDPRLQALPTNEPARPPSREIWMLSHVEHAGRASVGAVKDWLSRLDWTSP